MSNFILLHSIYDNREVLIDFDRVSHCEEKDNGEDHNTCLYTDTSSFISWHIVKETPEEILKMLNNGE